MSNFVSKFAGAKEKTEAKKFQAGLKKDPSLALDMAKILAERGIDAINAKIANEDANEAKAIALAREQQKQAA